jgi:hypothetical protein
LIRRMLRRRRAPQGPAPESPSDRLDVDES